jgi:hypothetical protein
MIRIIKIEQNKHCITMSLFGKKHELVTITDVIFISTTAKFQACIEQTRENGNTIFIAWFEETLQRMQVFFKEQNVPAQTILYRQATTHLINSNNIIFAEHYPWQKKETALFQSLNLKEVTIFSSLDEPLFKYFGGDKMIEIVHSMGMKDNEALQHPLITKALKNAQEKIEKKIVIEQSALSQRDWFERNLKE